MDDSCLLIELVERVGLGREDILTPLDFACEQVSEDLVIRTGDEVVSDSSSDLVDGISFVVVDIFGFVEILLNQHF